MKGDGAGRRRMKGDWAVRRRMKGTGRDGDHPFPRLTPTLPYAYQGVAHRGRVAAVPAVAQDHDTARVHRRIEEMRVPHQLLALLGHQQRRVERGSEV